MVRYYGNQVLNDLPDTRLPLDDASYKLSIRFTAKHSKSVQKISVLPIASVVVPEYRIGIQGDDGVGKPTGTWLGPTGSGYADFTPVDDVWTNLTLNEKVPILRSRVYHIVMEYKSGTIGPSNYGGNYYLGGPHNQRWGFDSVYDGWMKYLWYDGVAWTEQAHDIVFLLTYADGSTYGLCYFNRDYGVIGGNNQQCERMVMSETVKVKAVDVYVYKGVATPSDDLYVDLYDETDGVTVETVTIPEADVPATIAWVSAVFSQVRTLQNGKTYKLILSSPGGASGDYKWHNAHGGAAPLDKYTWKGTDHCRQVSSDGGGSWTSYSHRDFAFRFTEVFTEALTTLVTGC